VGMEMAKWKSYAADHIRLPGKLMEKYGKI
jgi:hypothetical protein